MAGADLILLLGRYRLPTNTEADLQAAIERVLTDNHVKFEREKQLGIFGRIDFKVDGVGIEVKLWAHAAKVYRQCQSYCRCSEIKEILLVTARTIGWPPTIEGKPAWILPIGRAYL